MLLIKPMSRDRIPAYIRGFADWYAHALADSGQGTVDELHPQVLGHITPGLDGEGAPIGSTVFDIYSDAHDAPVGVVWAGEMDFGLGKFLYVHDLRIHAPFRRRGLARRVLGDIHSIARAQGQCRGVALSVLISNAGARELYAESGFVALSQVMIRPISAPTVDHVDALPLSTSDL